MRTHSMNQTQNINLHEDEILEAYRRSEKISVSLFVVIMLLLAGSIFVVSLLPKDKDVASLLLSTAVSLVVSLVFTIFYTFVVDRAQSQSDSRAQSLEIADVKRE